MSDQTLKLLEAFTLRDDVKNPLKAYLVDTDHNVTERWVIKGELKQCIDDETQQDCLPPGKAPYGDVWTDFDGELTHVRAVYVDNNRPHFVVWNGDKGEWQLVYPHPRANSWHNNKNQDVTSPSRMALAKALPSFSGTDKNAGVTAALETMTGWVLIFAGTAYCAYRAGAKGKGKAKQVPGGGSVQAAFRGEWGKDVRTAHLYDGRTWRRCSVQGSGEDTELKAV